MPSKSRKGSDSSTATDTENKINGKKKSKRLGMFERNDDVETPPDFFKELDDEFNFDHDPCPLHCPPEKNALKHGIKWGKRNFVNPPYHNIRGFARKASRQWRKYGRASVFLITLRPSSEYWNKYILPYATEVRVLTSRLTFVGYDKPFPAPLAIVIIGFFSSSHKDSNHSNHSHNSRGIGIGGVIHKRTYSYF